MRQRIRRANVVLSAIVAAVATASCLAVPASGHPGALESGPVVGPPPTTKSAFGAFLESDGRGVRQILSLEKWLGGAEVRVGHTYLPGGSWEDIEGKVDFIQDWAEWRQARADRILVLNVPMQEDNEADVSDEQVRKLLKRGAAGSFDGHFKALAERLVRLRIPDTVIVLGWEMNGTTYTHRCGPDPTSWMAYWRSAVSAMRSVPGQRLRFDFAPSRGRDAVAWTSCYPGNDFVDIIGMDSYDQPSGVSFDEQVNEPLGLQDHVDFAAAHQKPISYPEWGLFRNGDNADYMRRMLKWIDLHKPIYNTITDYCPHGVWRCTENPTASKVYRSAIAACTGSTSKPVGWPAAVESSSLWEDVILNPDWNRFLLTDPQPALEPNCHP